MRIQVIKIGRPATEEIESLTNRYLVRLKPFAKLENIIWKEKEAETYIKKMADTKIILLEERGKQFSTLELVDQMKKWKSDPGCKQLTFVIGGPYGFDSETKQRADLLWSLSRTTLPSDIAWLVVIEQLYRVFTVEKGMAYHHD